MTYLAETDPDTALEPLQSAACTYRIALGPRAGEKVLSLQTVPSQPAQPTQQRCVVAHGFSLHATVCRVGNSFPSFSEQALAATLSVLLGTNLFVRRLVRSSPVQNEVVSYICAMAGLEDEAEKFRFSQADLSYRGAADYLLLRGLKADQASRKRYVAALKAMLMSEAMSPKSTESIIRSIKVLLGSSYDETSLLSIVKKAVREGEDPARLRDEIDTFLATELA